ncbi:hypothetical protein [Actinokineospora enzanensis]|uniref:hypothetical protein n=1 Tax=Actinokineospora enzanensis TaxID=155975 RepID=UPI00037FF976|nr:hypothetical protein [Actinokineospora enzanensis]
MTATATVTDARRAGVSSHHHFRTIGAARTRWGHVPLVRLAGPGCPPLVLTGPEVATALGIAGSRLLGDAHPARIAADAWAGVLDAGVDLVRALTDAVPDPVAHAIRDGHLTEVYRLTHDHDMRRHHTLATRLATAAPHPVDLDD